MHRFIRPALIAAGVIVLIVFSLMSSKENAPAEIPAEETPPAFMEQNITATKNEAPANVEKGPLLVDVKGAVRNPGIYELKPDARVADAIERAGGLLKDADGNLVNFAQRVQDEMVIHIVKEGEEPASGQSFPTVTGTGKPGESSGGDAVDINHADEAVLQTLPGVGLSKAQAIIRHREEHGPFSSPEAITDVSGIGQKTFENLQDQIVAR